MDMRPGEVLVIVAGLAAGYWIVSKLMAKNKSNTKSDPPETHTEQKARSSDSNEKKPSANVEKDSGWAGVLKVGQTASIEEIREAYRGLISQYHPDKVAQLGPELQKLATERSMEINAAYQLAMKEHHNKK